MYQQVYQQVLEKFQSSPKAKKKLVKVCLHCKIQKSNFVQNYLRLVGTPGISIILPNNRI